MQMHKEALERDIIALKRKKELAGMLPHLYGFKFYKWAREFFESTNPTNLLCAANQISKSSTQIRKCIHWATEKSLWPKLWKMNPTQFWYLYPSKEVATVEFEKKWKVEFLPRGEMKDDPKYGWTEHYKGGHINEIEFFSGVTVYFKAYTQDVQKLQTGTVHAIFTDEELPEDLYPELSVRTAAVDGYFHMVFTATLGQDFWWDAIEEIGGDKETFVGAFKKQVSMWDCLKYEDGTPSAWTKEKIEAIKQRCGTKSEIQRRVYGRFIKSEGRKYSSFERSRNVIPPVTIPKDWNIFSGVDIGSGGPTGHPAAICFVAVNPEYTKGYVFRGWKGDKTTVTTSSDILLKYRELRGSLRPVIQAYDWQSKDFHTHASSIGETFTKAEKGQNLGEALLNTLFKNQMLQIFDIEELRELPKELQSLDNKTDKAKAKDDFTDSLRFATTLIPWNFSEITSEYVEDNNTDPEKGMDFEMIKKLELDRRRRGEYKPAQVNDIEEEIDAYNDLME